MARYVKGLVIGVLFVGTVLGAFALGNWVTDTVSDVQAKAAARDRDVWLILQCDQPRLVMFVNREGKLETHTVSSVSDLAPFSARAKVASHKYAIVLNRNCGLMAVEK